MRRLHINCVAESLQRWPGRLDSISTQRRWCSSANHRSTPSQDAVAMALATRRVTWNFRSREEERIVRTTLHEVGNYKEDTKLSLKIFHFQELSRTSLKDRHLIRDPRYVQLRDEVHDRVRELSPAQVVAAAVSCGRLKVKLRKPWSLLARQIDRATRKTKSGVPGLSSTEVCLSLHAFGRARIRVREKFYYHMIRHLAWNFELLTEFDMAWLLGAMRHRRLKPTDPDNHYHVLWAKTLKAILAFFEQKLHYFSPTGIVIILYQFSRHDVFPGRCLFRAINRVNTYLDDLKPQTLVTLADTLARLDWPERRLLRRIGRQICSPEKFLMTSPRSFVMLLNSYGKLHTRDTAFLTAACDLLAKACDRLDDPSCAILAHSLGVLGVRHAVWGPLSERLQVRVSERRHPPLHLAHIAHGLGKVGLKDEELLQKVCDSSLEALPGFSPKHLARLLDGLALTGYFREDIFNAAIREYVRLGSTGPWARQSMLSRVFFCAVLEAPALLAGAPPATKVLLDRSRSSFQSTPEQPYHYELADCLTALGLKFKTRRKKGPYTVDAWIQAPSGNLALQLFAEADLCPLTGELLGPARLRQRHLTHMQWTSLGVSRKDWLSLKSVSERIEALQSMLERYVRTKRGTKAFVAKPETKAIAA